MASKNLVELSDEQLLKNEKVIKVVLILAITSAAILLGAGIYLTIVKKKFNALTILPLALMGLNMTSFNKLKEIKSEKARRGL